MIQTTIPCRYCGEPTIEIEFTRHFRRVCKNGECPLHREGQGNRAKEIKLGPITTFMPAPLTISPPRGMKKVRKKTILRRGLEYARKTL